MVTITDGVGLMSTSEWKYERTNSKGERVYRRDTNESLAFVTEYLDEKKIPYEISKSAGLLFIDNIADTTYVYYWSTGRWSKRKTTIRQYKKHFHSKGIEDFTTNYLNKYAEEHMTYHEDKHIACFSYPNCDEAPNGCIVRSSSKSKSTLHIGGDVEYFGHKG
jgi:hypothetical protein